MQKSLNQKEPDQSNKDIWETSKEPKSDLNLK